MRSHSRSTQAARVEAMWRTLAACGVSDGVLRLGYKPHVTLGIYPDDTPVVRLLTAAREASESWAAQSLVFSNLGLFPDARATLFLAPASSRTLLACHAGLLTSVAACRTEFFGNRSASA